MARVKCEFHGMGCDYVTDRRDDFEVMVICPRHWQMADEASRRRYRRFSQWASAMRDKASKMRNNSSPAGWSRFLRVSAIAARATERANHAYARVVTEIAIKLSRGR